MIPDLFPQKGDKISGEFSWRNQILLPFIYARENWMCWKTNLWLCSNPASSVHESLYSRQDVRGWKANIRNLIHTPYNCIALCNECHQIPPSKENVLQWMINEYGIAVIEWALDLPFKKNPLQYLLERYI
jgi:hypothetical protein